MGTGDTSQRPDITAMALSKAAVQTSQRAMLTATLACDAFKRAYDEAAGDGERARLDRMASLTGHLRDALLDAIGTVPKADRERISSARATITSDELIDLLALTVRG